jgi:hypothetical protein
MLHKITSTAPCGTPLFFGFCPIGATNQKYKTVKLQEQRI